MIKPLTKEAIGNEFSSELSVQDYSKKPTIDGVQLINLNFFIDDGGHLAEVVRLDENGNLQVLPDFKVRQSTFSQMLPGTIKAFHLHYNQEDCWFFLPHDRLLIGFRCSQGFADITTRCVSFSVQGKRRFSTSHAASLTA